MTFSDSMATEKRQVALSSVFAAVFLTVFKLFVGWQTGSLGILSEAAHSGLDLGAALLTFLAVRISDKPADQDHAYGHGKIENVSALLQMILLIGTCFIILKVAVDRILAGDAQVEITVWSFVVMILSIGVDYWRSRRLSYMARKYRSQALEADALHFHTDIWSSMVVLIGLALNAAGFHHGDSLAAIGVAVLVLGVSFRLLRRTVEALTDSTPLEIEKKVRAVVPTVEGIHSFRSLRTRMSGSKVFVDMFVDIKRTIPFEQAHLVTEELEGRIAAVVPNADILIHMEPMESPDESMIDKIRMIVTEQGLTCHNIRAQKVDDSFHVDFHLECDNTIPFKEAHDSAIAIEQKLISKVPQIKGVKIHIEDARDRVVHARNVTGQRADLTEAVTLIVGEHASILGCQELLILEIGKGLKLMMTCNIADRYSLDEVHHVMSQLEHDLYGRLPELTQIIIHPKVAEAANP